MNKVIDKLKKDNSNALKKQQEDRDNFNNRMKTLEHSNYKLTQEKEELMEENQEFLNQIKLHWTVSTLKDVLSDNLTMDNWDMFVDILNE